MNNSFRERNESVCVTHFAYLYKYNTTKFMEKKIKLITFIN